MSVLSTVEKFFQSVLQNRVIRAALRIPLPIVNKPASVVREARANTSQSASASRWSCPEGVTGKKSIMWQATV